MKSQLYRIISGVIFLSLFNFTQTSAAEPADSTFKGAGFRGSHIYSYKTDYWTAVGSAMSRNFEGYSPAATWIVSFFQDDGSTQMVFPSEGKQYPNISFAGSDNAERYLSKFDSSGIKVWLQVEPGNADMVTLINLVLSRYKQHKCVAGFGVDAEWYFNNGQYPNNNYGIRITDSTAQLWESAVKSVNPSYSLFLKHFVESHMPPSYRGEIIFVDDSQQFTDINDMLRYFKKWGSTFSSNKVEFQFGYKADKTWWSKYSNPPKALGDAIRNAIPNTAGLFWVDFTITDVFPLSITGMGSEHAGAPGEYELSQNYPNPFNPSTTIEYSISESGPVTLRIYDVLGKEITTLVNEVMPAGKHSVVFNSSTLPSGVYMYRIEAGAFSSTKKLVLLR
ncbi:MAG: T9SS type A sorting domain-containing protein [Ignavibacteriales bacterium]